MGLLLGMKANISDCFLLPANLSLFYCCSLDSGVNTSTILALGNMCRNSGWGRNTQISLLCCKTCPKRCWLSWCESPLEQLDEFTFKTQLLDQNAHLCKKKKKWGRRFWENGCEFLSTQGKTDKSVQIKAGIFQWALGNWASGER